MTLYNTADEALQNGVVHMLCNQLCMREEAVRFYLETMNPDIDELILSRPTKNKYEQLAVAVFTCLKNKEEHKKILLEATKIKLQESYKLIDFLPF